MQSAFIGVLLSLSIGLGSALAIGNRDIEKDIKNIEPVVEQTIVIQKPTIEYKAQELRDPFKGYEAKQDSKGKTTTVSQLPPLSVQGVVWGGQTPQAIINGSVVTPGETISGVKVISIDKYGVKVLFEGRPYEVLSPAGGYLKKLEGKSGGKDEKK